MHNDQDPHLYTPDSSQKSVVDGFMENHSMLEKALAGLVICLKNHNGDIIKVRNHELLIASDLPPAAFSYYYSNAYGIMSDVHRELSGEISNVVSFASRYSIDARSALYILLKSLSQQPRMLRVIALSNDFNFWHIYLHGFVKHYSARWQSQDAAHQGFLYDSFCFLFSLVIRKWESLDFSPDHLHACTDLLAQLLSTDVIYSDTILSWLHQDANTASPSPPRPSLPYVAHPG